MQLIRYHYTLLLSCALLAATTAHADIYKYVHNGVVTYSAEKPRHGAFESLQPSCLTSYIGCDLDLSDWNRVRLNHSAFKDLIEKSAKTHKVDASLIRAVIHAESNFNQSARSKAGAEGLMQLMPDTQKRLQVKRPFNAWENIDGGTRLLKRLLKRYGDNIRLAAAAYNAGTRAVQKYRGIPPYEETQNYVRRVSHLYSRYRQIY